MSKSVPAIRDIKARALIAPISRPVKNAFGVIEAAPLVLLDVSTDQGVTGRSYIFAYTSLTLKPLVHLIEEIGRDLTGKAIAPFDLMAAMDAKFRLLSWQGLVGMAVSGLDMAFWDALGQAAGQPLVELLGGSPRQRSRLWRSPLPPRSGLPTRRSRWSSGRSTAGTSRRPTASSSARSETH